MDATSNANRLIYSKFKFLFMTITVVSLIRNPHQNYRLNMQNTPPAVRIFSEYVAFFESNGMEGKDFIKILFSTLILSNLSFQSVGPLAPQGLKKQSTIHHEWNTQI